MQRRRFITGTALVGLGAAGLGAFALGRGGETSPDAVPVSGAPDTGTVADVPDMVLGKPGQGAQIIEYASLTCPHCAAFHAGALPRVEAELIETGRAHLVFREVYFDRPGLWASMIARRAGPERYFGIIKLFYDRQDTWTRGAPADMAAALRRIAKVGGMTDTLIDAALEDSETATRLMRWYEANAARDGIRATPTVIVNGTTLGSVGYAPIAEAVDAAG